MIINSAQGTSVEGRKIGDNIFLYQNFLLNYHRLSNKGKNYAMKIDIIKAYDHVDWNFLFGALKLF